MDPLFTTQAGLRRTRERLAQARAAYDAVTASNPEANEAGDSSVWHDNFAYEENQRQMHQLARRVRDLGQVLARMTVVGVEAEPAVVGVGCGVEVLESSTGRTLRYVIAGYDDGDLRDGRVAYNSPLGEALLGAAPGDVREVRCAGGEREVEVLAIRRADGEHA